MKSFKEVNFDGLIGPTHNYAGLSFGNIASKKNANLKSSPRSAALQGLAKMKTLADMGYVQGFIPPLMRPRFDILHQLGFSGTAEQVLNKLSKQAPELLPMVYSASSMWTANAATVTPSPDSSDGRVHFSPANLVTAPHRSVEVAQTRALLRQMFADVNHFVVHDSLPNHVIFGDEGAANHTRFCEHYGDRGHALFVYGARSGSDIAPSRFPARQTLMASEAIARCHDLSSDAVTFLQQDPSAIDGGAFHNDVVAVGNGHFLFYHENAYPREFKAMVFRQIEKTVPSFHHVMVPTNRVSLEDAVNTYLFNSQLLAKPDGDLSSMTLIAPTESQEHATVNAYLNELVMDGANPIDAVQYVDVRESMSNGGGPACLRLRVVLNDEQLSAMHQGVLLNTDRYALLTEWVNRHYRDELEPNDLRDVALVYEVADAFGELAQILDMKFDGSCLGL